MLPGFPEAAPVAGLFGGALIGMATALMLLGAGRIAGVSGMVARATGLADSGPPRSFAWLFVVGLVVGALLFVVLVGPIEARFNPSFALIALAGLITGFGTRMGSGCTSGHGVCGMSRLSPRSLLATMTFIAAGMVTVALFNIFGGGW